MKRNMETEYESVGHQERVYDRKMEAMYRTCVLLILEQLFK
jgi:hypothetical protein